MKQTFLLPVKILLCKAFGAAHLQQVLEQTGLEKADIDAIVAVKDDATDFKPDDFVGKVATTFQNKLSNDPAFLGKLNINQFPPEFTNPIRDGQFARFMNIAKKSVTDKGIDISDLAAEDANNPARLIDKAFEKYSKKMGSPEALNELQTNLQKALQENDQIKTSIPTQLAEVENKVKGQMSDTITKLVGINTLSSLKDEKGNSLLLVEPAYVADTILNNVRSKYTVVTDGVNVRLMQKENPTLKAIDNAGKEITFEAAVKEEAKAGKLIRETQQQQQEENKGRVKIEVNGENVLSSSVQKKIDAALALESKK